MRKDAAINLLLRTAAATAVLVFLWRTSPAVSIPWTDWLALSVLCVGLAVADGRGGSSVHAATPVEFGLLVLAGVPVAVVVHALVLSVHTLVSMGKTEAEPLVDDLTRSAFAMMIVYAVQLQEWRIGGVVLAALIYVLVIESRAVLDSMRDANSELSLDSMLVAAEVSSAILLVILYPRLLLWGALLVVVVLAIVKYSADLLFRVRQAYQSMLEATVAALEAGDVASEGHGLRVSKIAVRIGRGLGYRGRQLETLSRAALLHELVVSHPHQMERSAELERVRYLSPVVPVLRALQGAVEGVDADAAEMAYIVHRAADLDAASSRINRVCTARSYRCSPGLGLDSVRRVDDVLRKVLVQDA